MKINSFNIDISDMPTEVTTRKFIVTGEVGSEFEIIAVESGTLKYYNFLDSEFALGHNNINNNLKVTLASKKYTNTITFPSGGGDYVVKLIAASGTEVQNARLNVLSKSISKQTANAVVTFKAGTGTGTAANYATFPTTTSTGPINSTAKESFNWDITNASTDAKGFGLRLTGDHAKINEKYWYFTTSEAVADNPAGDGEDSETVVVADTTDLAIGTQLYYHKASTVPTNKAGSAVGTTLITAIDTETKTITFSQAVAFEDTETMTFRAYNSSNIFDAIGLKLSFGLYPIVTPTVLTKVVRADGSVADEATDGSNVKIALAGTYGIAGGDFVSFKGVGVNNAVLSTVSEVTTPSSTAGLITVSRAQTLRAGAVITFTGCNQVINFAGDININQFPAVNRTIYLDLDLLITVGAAS